MNLAQKELSKFDHVVKDLKVTSSLFVLKTTEAAFQAFARTLKIPLYSRLVSSLTF